MTSTGETERNSERNSNESGDDGVISCDRLKPTLEEFKAILKRSQALYRQLEALCLDLDKSNHSDRAGTE